MGVRSFGSLIQFATFCGSLAAQHRSHKHALEEACVHLETRVKQVIGTYDLQPRWAELADATKDDRSRKGYPENDPLLRTGHLRDSVQHKVEGDTGRVGTDDDIAVYQELGTRSIPPRSYLRLSAVEQEHELVKILERGAVSFISR